MTAPDRACPWCGATGPLRAFPLVPADLRPPQHRRRRLCRACGHDGPAWVFRGRPLPTDPLHGADEEEEVTA